MQKYQSKRSLGGAEHESKRRGAGAGAGMKESKSRARGRRKDEQAEVTTLALVSSRREMEHGLASTNALTLCDHDEDGAKLSKLSDLPFAGGH